MISIGKFKWAAAKSVTLNVIIAARVRRHAVAEKLAAMHMAAFCRAMAIDAGHSRIL
jgi:hypothetical protein